MKKYKPIDLSKIKTYSAKKRKTKVELNSFAKISTKGTSFKKFYDSLPKFLAANSLNEVVIPPIEGRSTTNIVERILSRK